MIINFSNLGSGGGSGSGSTVAWRQDLTAGTQIAQITINGTSQNVYAPSGSSYTLPVATSSELGGVKIGSGINIDASGVISVEGGGSVIQNYQIVSALTDVQGEESSVTYSGYTFDFSGVTVDTAGGISSSDYSVIYADFTYMLSEGGAMYWNDTSTWEMHPIDDDNQWHNYYGDVFFKRNGSFVSIVFAGYTGEEVVQLSNMETWEPSEEVATGTTSDTIVAVVVLEGTVAYVTTDGKFYQHLDNDWVEMPDASAGQMRYVVSSTTEMDSLEANEGDICVVLSSETTSELNGESLAYDLLFMGHNLKSAIDLESNNTIGKDPDAVIFEVIANPYYSSSSAQAYAVFTPDWGATYYGINEDSGNPQMNYGGSNWYDWLTVGEGDQLRVGNWANVSLAQENSPINLLNTEQNNKNSLVFKVSVTSIQAGGTYQYNKGQWIELASLDDVSSAMTQANQAYSLAQSKLSDSSVQIGTWGDFEYYGNGVYSTQVNSVDEGVRLHIMGAKTNYTNPRIDQIVTSDSFLRIMKMTQDEYDNLQTKDSNVCYIIVEEE